MSKHRVGRIAAIAYVESADPSRPASLRVDVESRGYRGSQPLALSGRNAAAVGRWFRGLGFDGDTFEVDDDTDLLLEPDLAGTRVVFDVTPDGNVEVLGRA